MINTEAVDSMIEELEQCRKDISVLTLHISLVKHGAGNWTYADGALEMFEQSLEREKASARFINDLLAIEYEQLEIVPILQELHT